MNRKWGKKWMAAMLSISMVIGMFPGVGNPVRVLADEPPGQAVTQADTSNADNSGKDKYGFNLTTPSSFNANEGLLCWTGFETEQQWIYAEPYSIRRS